VIQEPGGRQVGLVDLGKSPWVNFTGSLHAPSLSHEGRMSQKQVSRKHGVYTDPWLLNMQVNLLLIMLRKCLTFSR